jgi:hypothetical protein
MRPRKMFFFTNPTTFSTLSLLSGSDLRQNTGWKSTPLQFDYHFLCAYYIHRNQLEPDAHILNPVTSHNHAVVFLYTCLSLLSYVFAEQNYRQFYYALLEDYHSTPSICLLFMMLINRD